MATRTGTGVVYGAGLVQGIALVTFPAASTIFTDPDEYDLSRTQYGTLFIPHVVTAIVAALLGSGLAGRFGSKRAYLAGLGAGLLSMALLLAGGVIAFYQLGYGIAAFGVGPLRDAGVELSAIYAVAAVVAVGMGAWSFAVAGRRPDPATLHPRPGLTAR